jgi:hypothetical protein
MKTIKCSKCKKVCVSDGITAGYGIDKNNKKVCFECCSKEDKEKLLKSKIGDKFTFYYSGGHISNWPGTFKIPIHQIRNNKHNWWGVKRVDVWFTFEGMNFWGLHVGSSHQLMTVTRIKG